MSTQLGKLCSALLLELFGETVQKVGDDIFKWRGRPMALMVKNTGLPVVEVKKALRTLVQYGFVSFSPSTKDTTRALYTISSENILYVIRYPKYLLLIKKCFGDESEMLMEEMLRHGKDTASNLIARTTKRFKEATKQEDITTLTFRDKFVALVNARYFRRCSIPSEDGASVPTLTIENRDMFIAPIFNLKVLQEMEDGITSGDPGDRNILWEVNFDRFIQESRDQLMIQAISRRVDENAGHLLKYFLQDMYSRTGAWEDTSNPVPFNNLKETIKKHREAHPQLNEFLDSYCRVLDEDSSEFINRYSGSNGDHYTVNIGNAIVQLTWTTVENIVQERFGSKAARIFRIVKAKKKIDQDQIQPIAMIPAKEAKSLTYQLLGENFLQMEELRKSVSNNGPVKTFFLFHIDLSQLVRMILEMCYKSVLNAMIRRDFEVNENKRLIDKHHRIKTIAQNMKEQGATAEQIVEIEEMITPIEVSVVEKVEKMIKGFSAAELQIDQTMFILQLYIYYKETSSMR